MTFDEVYLKKTVETCGSNSYSAFIIGDKNNLYMDQGVLVDSKGCLLPYRKNEFNYFYSPGTPVCIEKDLDKDGYAVINGVLKKEVKVGSKDIDMLWDGRESHPLVHLHNLINRVLLAEVFNGKVSSIEQNEIMACAATELIADDEFRKKLKSEYDDCQKKVKNKGKGKGKEKGKSKS